MSISPKLKKSARRSLEWVKLMAEAVQDAHRYYRAASWAGPGGRHRMTHLESDLIKGYHVLEKGLTMADYRPRAGADVLRHLIATVRLWKDSGGDNSLFHYRAACAVICAYSGKHRLLGVDVSDLIPPSLLEGQPQDLPAGGWKAPALMPASELAHYDKISLIPGHERIAMLIGCGYAALGHEVTCSPRAPAEDLITWHSGPET